MTTDTILLILNDLLGSGLICTLLFYNSKKRKASAEADSEETSALAKLTAQYETHIDTIVDDNKALRIERTEALTEAKNARKEAAHERERVVDAYKERSEALVQLEVMKGRYKLLEYYKCEKNSCKVRTPPRTELPPEE